MASPDSISTSRSNQTYWQEQLAHFRMSHPNHQFESDGLCWNYLEGGQGSQWAVLLHSGAAGPESLYYQVNLLEANYRVLAPTIPHEAKTMKRACEGLAAILDHENIQTAHVAGCSLGGELAQCFLWLYPERIQSVVLSHTVLPTDSHAEGSVQVQKEYESISEEQVLEEMLLMLQERHAHQLKSLDPDDWTAFIVTLEELYRTQCVQKTQVLGWLALEENYHRYYSRMPERQKQVPMLIIESDGDEVYTLKDQEALKAAYPNAQVHTFEGFGHLGILAAGPVIEAFLARI